MAGAFVVLAFAGCGSNGSSGPSPLSTGPTKPPTVVGHVAPQPAPSHVACGAQAPPDAHHAKPQFSGPPPITIDPSKTYTATMKTSCGTITIQLAADTAPITVNNFVFLARQGYFDGQHFHRLDTSIDVVQGGDPTGTGTGGPGYAIPDELSGNETYPTGTVAMANAGPNTGGSQFFIITGPKGQVLNGNNAYPVFGHIVAGLDVAQRIQSLPIKNPQGAAGGDIGGQQPKQAVYIDKVTIKET